ncbi:sigma 54 modulation/S30EA ribosomal C-terminal domain-containing protein [Cryptosporangium aurantiacum]|uniref:Sigma 54 modulation/S30EA ribosomal protein C terminus n=1 Tax=Cryptosporangium aurantiacum TaxID=134849 RepID=A0A1M7RLF5_9ACTN|nr:sigma 54 modulation/S30EA ribosomal C-terminal domain-containing protein [Cryptosporangium aurantiacum]SHN46986.1 Sigma 54 modulation/S30EA ribosomal protein C terminus [Cryptosporangium aurantiacum]
MTTRDVAVVRAETRPATPAPERGYAVGVTLGGQLPSDVAGYARAAVRAAIGHRRDPILRADLRIVRYADPALPRPVASYATVNVNGTRVRVHTTARTPYEGLDELRQELTAAFERLDRNRREDAHRRPPTAGLPAAPRIRVPGVVSGGCTIDEAIAVLDLLDRNFELFRDVGTGEDTLLHRAGPTGYRLVQARRQPLGARPSTPVSIAGDPALRLSVEVAAVRLARSEQPFVFFTDVATGRGTVLYVRRDGDYGVVTLA